jgi:DNA-binding MarR family transcriptional regulator
MSAPEDDRETAEIAVRLSVTMTRLRSRLRAEAGIPTSGFTISQLAILQRVLEGGPATAAAMAAAEHVSQQAIAQSVTALKAAGLVSGERDTNDARKVLISATDAGRELFASMLASRQAWLARAIDAIVPPEERAALEKAVDLLARLADADPRPADGR